MAEVIDSLLVRLGLESDEQSFRNAESQFASVRRTALQFAGTIGAGLGFDQLSRGVANANDQLGLTAQQIGVTARELDSLQFAFERSGGSADDAVSSLRSANDALDALRMGDIPGFEMAARWDLDVDRLMESADAMQFMLRLTDELEGKTGQQQRNILEAFGLGGEGTFNLLTGGRNDLEGMLDQAQNLSPTLGGLVDSSREFNESLAELTRSVEGITNVVGQDFIEDLTAFSDVLSQFLSENRDIINEVLTTDPAEFGAQGGEAVRNYLGDMFGSPRRGQGGMPTVSDEAIRSAQIVGSNTNVRDNAAIREAVAQAEREIGAPAGLLWAQMGQESSYNPNAVSSAGARGLAQIMPGTERSLEQRMGRDLDPFNPSDAIDMQAALMRENYQNTGNWEEALRLYHGGYDRSQWGPTNEAYAPSIRERMGGGSTTQNNTFNISGSDPQENAREIERVLRRSADQARQDTANEVY